MKCIIMLSQQHDHVQQACFVSCHFMAIFLRNVGHWPVKSIVDLTHVHVFFSFRHKYYKSSLAPVYITVVL